MADAQLKHGDACRGKITRLYRIWHNMKSRCTNVNKPDYKYYGAKGIKICEEWEDYLTFKQWAINNGYADNLTIDRIDSNGNYCPENCRWITIQKQQTNKQSNRILVFNNEAHTISEWAQILNISRGLIKDRIRAGWSVERALTEPVNPIKKEITFNGETHSWTEWANITGIPRKILYYRYNDRGWSIEDTLTQPVEQKTIQN